MIPLDRTRLLELGCGAGDWSRRIAEHHPWMEVTGVDVGAELIAAARARGDVDGRVKFVVADFAELDLDDGSFDAICADNSLEHAFSVDGALSECHRVLAPGGVLVASIPPDGRNPARICDNHTWKTIPSEVRERLSHAGFVDITIEEVDVFGALGLPPFPPSDSRSMLIRAWKRAAPQAPIERLDELTHWVYRSLDPSRDSAAEDPARILSDGYAWCAGYVLVLGEACRREGWGVRYVTLNAEDHPRGRGARLADTHEVLEVTLPDGSTYVADPTAAVRFPVGLQQLLADPRLANTGHEPDERFASRRYDLYATSFLYERVASVAVRRGPHDMQVFVSRRAFERLGTARLALMSHGLTMASQKARATWDRVRLSSPLR